MRINTITVDNRAKSQQVRLIYGSYNPIVEWIGHSSVPLAYIFIESVLDSHILDQSGVLPDILRTGLSKLRTALTADSAEDLYMLLRFMGPHAKVSELKKVLDSANNYSGNILDDQQWWDAIFASTNIQDDNVQNTIRRQVSNLMGPAPAAAQPAQQATDSSPDDADTYQQSMRAAKQAASSRPSGEYIQQQRQQEQEYNDYLSQQLEQIRAGREANRAEIQKLMQAIEDQKRQAHTESVCNIVALTLLENAHVTSNMSLINKLMSRKLSDICGSNNIPIQEAGAVGRLKKAFQNLGNLAANPGLLGPTGIKSAGIQAENQRAAKLAVQLIANHLRSVFDQKLQAADMKPEDIVSDYQKYLKLKPLRDSGKLSGASVQEFNALMQKFRQVGQLFDQQQTQAAAMPQDDSTTAPADSLTVAGPSGVEDASTAAPADAAPADASTSPESAATPDALEVAGPSGVEDQPLEEWQKRELKDKWLRSSPAERGVTATSSKLNEQQKKDAIGLLSQIKQTVAQTVKQQWYNATRSMVENLEENVINQYEQQLFTYATNAAERRQLDILTNPTSYEQYLDKHLDSWVRDFNGHIYMRLSIATKDAADKLAYDYSQIDNNVASAVHQYFCASEITVSNPFYGSEDDDKELTITRVQDLTIRLVKRLLPSFIAKIKTDLLVKVKGLAEKIKNKRSLMSRLLGRNR